MGSYNPDLLRFILNPRKKSVSAPFEELLTNEINIPEAIRSTASTSQQHLREFLQDECKRDATFPSILQTVDKDFLGGSFGRQTKTRPLDDIDIYLPLDGAALYYLGPMGVPLPYTVLTDRPSSWNAALGPRFAVGNLVSSSKLIREFAGVLKRRFPNTTVKPTGQAISIQMTHGETRNNGGLGYDVVPCFSLEPRDQNERRFYLMPDGNGGWIRTNPRVDAAIADVLQDHHNRYFRKCVKLLKYWNAEQLNGVLESYFIELSIARVFWEYAVKKSPVTVLSHGVALSFWAVDQAVCKGFQESWIPNAPPVLATALAGDQLSIKSATAQACSAWDDEKEGRLISSVSKWKRVFGPRFPD